MTFAANKSEQPQLQSCARLLRHASVLLPFLLLVGTGLSGLDFGLHWDERPWQIGPVKQMGGQAPYCLDTTIILRSTIGSIFWSSRRMPRPRESLVKVFAGTFCGPSTPLRT
jgi:hypothetical protein